MPVCFDLTAHCIDTFVVNSGGRVTIMKFVLGINTSVLEFRKPVINSPIAWCFIAKSSSKPRILRGAVAGVTKSKLPWFVRWRSPPATGVWCTRLPPRTLLSKHISHVEPTTAGEEWCSSEITNHILHVPYEVERQVGESSGPPVEKEQRHEALGDTVGDMVLSRQIAALKTEVIRRHAIRVLGT
ncbi:hypothetical protein EVAR_47915_1 [Eumeta japonica]|uniref:Uncharacterized protein n=1 Tax=Eumeta variegata TaxID=151549 RepID=A0A4C1Y6R8_EUMVA|nr:hypothetical protein EVAR_47915_1 [Eumeta japonica]